MPFNDRFAGYFASKEVKAVLTMKSSIGSRVDAARFS